MQYVQSKRGDFQLRYSRYVIYKCRLRTEWRYSLYLQINVSTVKQITLVLSAYLLLSALSDGHLLPPFVLYILFIFLSLLLRDRTRSTVQVSSGDSSSYIIRIPNICHRYKIAASVCIDLTRNSNAVFAQLN